MARGWGIRDMNRELEEKAEYREKWRTNWEIARRRGPLYFVFYSGLVYWGLATFAVITGFYLVTNHWAISTDKLSEFAIISIASGLVVGAIEWHKNEDLFIN